jgi:anaphase-promoting complex subunit 8
MSVTNRLTLLQLSALLPLFPIPPTHPLVQMLQIKLLNDFQSCSDNELALCDRLLRQDFFPNSLWIMTQRAIIYYWLHGQFLWLTLLLLLLMRPLDFGRASQEFDKIYKKDPLWIDGVAFYSDVLFVTEDSHKLHKLAKEFVALDLDRPEVCCVIGNHHSYSVLWLHF